MNDYDKGRLMVVHETVSKSRDVVSAVRDIVAYASEEEALFLQGIIDEMHHCATQLLLLATDD